MNPEMQKSILQMARGAIMERADYEMSRLLANILDPNTSRKPPSRSSSRSATAHLPSAAMAVRRRSGPPSTTRTPCPSTAWTPW